MDVQRIMVAGVPIDVINPEDMEKVILSLLEKNGTKQIIFLSVWDLLKALRNGDFKDCVNNADLVIPISKSIINGAVFLKQIRPIRYNPFNAVIHILSILDARLKSLYILGAHIQTLRTAEANLRGTFPYLSIVGRYIGYYPKTAEDDIMQAIYKASPSLILMSEGIKEKDCWAYRRRDRFSSGIFLYYKDALGIFSKRIKRIKEETFERGHEIYVEVLHNPFKLFLIFPYLAYIIILIWYRFFKNRKIKPVKNT